MKYIIRVFSFILFIFLLNGCSQDIIDKNPLDEAAPGDFLDSEEAYRSALDGVYAVMKKDLLGYNMCIITVPEAATDNLLTTNSGFTFTGIEKEIYPLAYSGNTFQLEGLWSTSYAAINNANTIIKQAKESGNEELNPFLGEALALRGYLHYNLYRLFAPAYSADPNALSIPYRLENDALLGDVSRPTNKEVITLVLNDLLEAEELANNDVNSYRMSLTAISALLSRVYHEIGDYEKAIIYAEKALTDDRYSLENTIEGLENEWYYDESEEIIFRIRFDESDAGMNAAMFAIPIYSSFPFIVPEELLNLYNRENDIRFPVYFGINPLDPTTFYPKKYNGLRTADAETFNPGATDVKLIRVPELYLILAESYARLGNDAKAKEALNILRNSRGLENYTESDQTLIKEILNERRREFVFEGMRFTELKRLQKGFIREDGTSMSPNDPRYAFPIPQLEIDRSGIPQNPGY